MKTHDLYCNYNFLLCVISFQALFGREGGRGKEVKIKGKYSKVVRFAFYRFYFLGF